MFSVSGLFLIAIGLLLLCNPAVADNLFVGCYTSDETTFTVQNPSVSSTALCYTSCSTGGYSYAAYRAGDQACFCSNSFERGNYMTSGNDDGCTAPTNLNVRTTETSFQLQNCYDSVTYANDGFNIFVVIEPKDCFRNCNGAYKATFQENSQNNYYMCHCSYNDFAAVGNPVTCSPTSYFAYFHTRDAQASGLVRRKVREQRDLTARREIRYCPSGLTACNVDDTGNYECLDTSSELESCGGCLNGRYGNSSASVGIDCTNTGAAFGASTCVNGQCVISACKKGLKLVDGKCRS